MFTYALLLLLLLFAPLYFSHLRRNGGESGKRKVKEKERGGGENEDSCADIAHFSSGFEVGTEKWGGKEKEGKKRLYFFPWCGLRKHRALRLWKDFHTSF